MGYNRFSDEWFKKEVVELDLISKTFDYGAPSIFLLRTLSSALNFFSKEEIKSLEDYEKVKKKLLEDNCLKDNEEIKHQIRKLGGDYGKKTT